MFDQLLTDAEVKAIARSRGFPAGSASSRSTVKNLFLSTIGVDQALSGLTMEELTVLHMLAEMEESVGISFFERIYHEPNFSFQHVYGLTFNQRYKDVLKETRERLVRRGILIIGTNVMAGDQRIEQWTFRLPPVVIERLPPLIRPTRLPGPPTTQEANYQALNNWLLELTGAHADSPL